MISGKKNRIFYLSFSLLPLGLFILFSALLAFQSFPRSSNNGLSILLSVALEVLIFGPYYVLALKKGRAFVFRFKLSGLSQAIFLWLVVFGFWQIYLLVMNVLRIAPDVAQAELFYGVKGAAGWLPVFLAVGFLGPFFEELYFRGVLFRTLRSIYDFKKASVVAAVIFGILHGLFYFCPLFVFGLLLNYLTERRNSLDAAVIIHMINNVIAVLYYYFFSGR
jgi:membrane protease YdiL (CAAX protease family)